MNIRWRILLVAFASACALTLVYSQSSLHVKHVASFKSDLESRRAAHVGEIEQRRQTDTPTPSPTPTPSTTAPPRNKAVFVMSEIIGWVYFLAWSVSFYPQVILNFRRKSVVGLSFDFLALNITGYVCYSIYTITIFFSKPVQAEYLARYGPPVPVHPQDVAFATHGFILTVVTIGQCFIYERGDQIVSFPSQLILAVMWGTIFGFIVVVSATSDTVFSWFFWVNWLSYIKVAVTALKYIPQAWYNFRRKSTIGWSITNIILDFTGGALSFVQQALDSYEAQSIAPFVGDPVKFLLSLLSIFFDSIFMLQHWVLYRDSNSDVDSLVSVVVKKTVGGDDGESDETSTLTKKKKKRGYDELGDSDDAVDAGSVQRVDV